MLFTGLQPCIIRFVTPAKHHMKANLPHYQFSLVSHRMFGHTLPTRANAVTGGLTSTARLVVDITGGKRLSLSGENIQPTRANSA
jgi:hypothetical protein